MRDGAKIADSQTNRWCRFDDVLGLGPRLSVTLVDDQSREWGRILLCRASFEIMTQVVSLQEQCQRCIASHFSEFSIEELLRVPSRLRCTLLFHNLSLADMWRLEKRGLSEGIDLEGYWDQEVVDRNVSLSGLDFVHRYDNTVLKWKAVFSHSIGGREIFFQRLWRDLEHAQKNKTRSHLRIVERLLLEAPSASKISNPFAVETVTREVLQAVLECGFRPSYLSYGPLMEILESEENAAIMKHVTSDVIGINTPWNKMGDMWFRSVLSNSMPTLKLSVHCDMLPNICNAVQKYGKKKLDELIISFNDCHAQTRLLSKFTESVLQSHFKHLRLLEISGFHLSYLGLVALKGVTLISSASPLVCLLQQPHFTCLRLSGVIHTTVAKSLIFTFLSIPCTSLQRLELSNMVSKRAPERALHSLPENNDYYPLKCLLIDNVCMVHAKEFSLNKYQLSKDCIILMLRRTQLTHCPNRDKENTLSSWLFKLPNLKIGTLQLYDYDTNCTNITVPSAVCIETLKVFIVFNSGDVCSTWTSPLFSTMIRLPSLQKCIWDVRTSDVIQNGNRYFQSLIDTLQDLEKLTSSNLQELSVSIDKEVAPEDQQSLKREVSVLSRLKVELYAFKGLLGETILTFRSGRDGITLVGYDVPDLYHEHRIL